MLIRLQYNCKGKSEVITIENVGGENLVSTYSEKTSWPTYKLRFFMDNSYAVFPHIVSAETILF